MEKKKIKRKKIIIPISIIFIFLIIYFGGFYKYLKTAIETVPEKVHEPDYPVVAIDTPFGGSMEMRQPTFPDKTCAITDYGAEENDKDANTKAFTDAIADCAKDGGGKVIVPPGKWLTGSIKLKSNINLYVDKDAEILFSTNFNDYLPVVFSRFEGVEYYNYSPPIYAKDAFNIAITGEGKINGQGEKSWWNMPIMRSIDIIYSMGHDNVPVEKRNFGNPDAGLRPAFIEFVNCHVVDMEDVTVINGPMWTIHPLYSQDVTIRRVKVETNPGKSTDGIAVDSSKNVLIEDTELSTGDDAIVMKSGRDLDGQRINIPTENVIIKNCHVKEAHAGFAIGSEVSGGIKNIYVKDMTIDNSQYGFRVKSASGRGASIENIWIDNMEVNFASMYGVRIDDLYESPFMPDNTVTTKISNINISSLSIFGTPRPIYMEGAGDNPVQNVTLSDVNIRSNYQPYFDATENVSINNMRISGKNFPKSPFTLNNSRKVNVTNYDCNASKSRRKDCFLISGADSAEISIRNDDPNMKAGTAAFQGVSSSVLLK